MPIKNKEKRNEYLRNWNAKNSDKLLEYNYAYLQRNPKKKLLKSAKYNAKTRGIEFTIDESDIVIPEYCPYLGIKLSIEIQTKTTNSSASLDRIDNSKGYIKGNVQVISNLANRMKANASIQDLLTFAQNVLILHEK